MGHRRGEHDRFRPGSRGRRRSCARSGDRTQPIRSRVLGRDRGDGRRTRPGACAHLRSSDLACAVGERVKPPPHRPAHRRSIAGTIAAGLRAKGRSELPPAVRAPGAGGAGDRLRGVSAGAVARRSSRSRERADRRWTDGAFRRGTRDLRSQVRTALCSAERDLHVRHGRHMRGRPSLAGTLSTNWRIAGSPLPSTKPTRAAGAGCFCR